MRSFRRSGSFSDDGDGCCCSSRCAWIVTLAILWSCAAALVVAGCVMAPIGAARKESAGSLDPDADFKSLGDTCFVQNIDLKQRTERERRRSGNREYIEWKCYHDYTYLFTYAGSEDGIARRTIFKSREETILLFKGQCPPYPLESRGRFVKGATQECWAPTGTPSSQYRCGNDECIKLFPPADERQSAIDSANGLFIAGIVIAAIGVALAAITGLIHWCVFCKDGGFRPDDDHNMQGDYPMHQMQPPMPLATAYDAQQQVVYGHPVAAHSVYPPPPQQPMPGGYGTNMNPGPSGYGAPSYPAAAPVAQQVPGGYHSYPNPPGAAGVPSHYPQPPPHQTSAAPSYPQYPQYPQAS